MNVGGRINKLINSEKRKFLIIAITSLQTRLNKFLVPPVSVKCRYNALLLTCPSTVGLKDDSVTTRNLPLALQLALGLIQVFLHYLCITIAAV